MKKITALLILIASMAALNVHANETEAKLEKSLEARIAKLNKAMVKYQEVKKVTTEDRDAMLRKVAKRIDSETKAISHELASLDFYLDLRATRRSTEDELDRTHKSITSLRDEIQSLRGRIAETANSKEMVAAK